MSRRPPGLVKHKNGTYYYRRRIPRDLETFYGRQTEISFSLNTKRYKDAVESFYREDAKVQNEWRIKRQQLANENVARQIDAFEVLTELSEEDLQRIGDHYVAVGLAGDDKRRLAGGYSLEDIEEYREAYQEVLPVMKSAVAIGDVKLLSPLLDEFLRLYNYDNQLSESDHKRLALAYGHAAIRVNQKLLQRYEGEHVPTPPFPTRQPGSTKKLSELTKAYIDKEYSSDNKAAMAKKVELVIPMFEQLVGDKPMRPLRTPVNGAGDGRPQAHNEVLL